MSGGKLLNRDEIAPELTWNLNLLYADDAAWERDFELLNGDLEMFLGFRGRLGSAAATLRSAIEALDALERRLEKLYSYSHMKHDENTLDAANRARESRVRTRAAEITAACAWFEPEIMAIPEPVMAELLAAAELAFYRPSLEELLRERPHTLSEPEERLLGGLSDVLGASSESYEALTDADMKFPVLDDGTGKKVELSHGNYRTFLEKSDRRVRRRAFTAMFSTYRSFENTLASTLAGEVKSHVLSARIRHHGSALERALFADELPTSIYRNLIAAVHEALPNLHGYLALRKRVLKLRKLDMYDLFCPLAPTARRTYSWEEAKSIVRAALSVMGPEYTALVDRAFAERWVDVMECRGKRSGAYSGGCYDSAPYLLLNFQGTLNDLFTLAHELGHSLHSYYSNHTQHYHYADYRIFVAEVASTTNELLLFDHLLRACSDKELEITLLAHLADEIRGTVYRQTMFAEFELRIHELVEKNIALTAERLNAEYEKLNTLYHGPGVDANGLIRHEWARIPHFYYNFYVYKYATGMSAALKLSRNILSGDAGLRERYFGFLKAGDSKNVLEIMQDAGVDFGDVGVIVEGLAEFGVTVARLDAALRA